MNNKFRIGDIVYVEDNDIGSYIGVIVFLYPYYKTYQYQIRKALSCAQLTFGTYDADEYQLRLAINEDFKSLSIN